MHIVQKIDVPESERYLADHFDVSRTMIRKILAVIKENPITTSEQPVDNQQIAENIEPIEEATTKKKPVDNQEKELNFPFFGEEFMEMWEKWVDYKASIGKPLYTNKKKQYQLNVIRRKAGGNEKIACLMFDEAIEREWDGLKDLSEKWQVKHGVKLIRGTGMHLDVTNLIEWMERDILGGRSVDGSRDINRRDCEDLIKKVKNDFPENEPIESIKIVIKKATEIDAFHKKNCTSFMYANNNFGKMFNAIEAPKKKINERPSVEELAARAYAETQKGRGTNNS